MIEKDALKKAMLKIDSMILDGLRHGFFEIKLKCEVCNGTKRRFSILAGKSDQYIISEEELN